MINEIYVARRIEYNGDSLYGLASTEEVASTSLSFMIKSFAGPYKDIVLLYLMCNSTAKKQQAFYKEVIALLQDVEFNVVAICIDNATANRKFYTD